MDNLLLYFNVFMYERDHVKINEGAKINYWSYHKLCGSAMSSFLGRLIQYVKNDWQIGLIKEVV